MEFSKLKLNNILKKYQNFYYQLKKNISYIVMNRIKIYYLIFKSKNNVFRISSNLEWMKETL